MYIGWEGAVKGGGREEGGRETDYLYILYNYIPSWALPKLLYPSYSVEIEGSSSSSKGQQKAEPQKTMSPTKKK